VAGLDAIAARDSDSDGLGGNFLIGVRTGGFEEVVRAARIEGGVIIGEGRWSTANDVVNIVTIFMIN
jgi:hypothetical protein